MNETIQYYNNHADIFVQDTQLVDMSVNYQKFIPLLPPGGLILDAGCGSGRDTLAFLKMGFQIIAIDASAAMIHATKQLVAAAGCDEYLDHCQMIQTTFQDFVLPATPDTANRRLDGIWASASLLHVQRSELAEVLHHLGDCLKSGGIFYVSFKYGDREYIRGERYFNCYDESAFRALLTQVPELQLHEMATTQDVRPSHEFEAWLNAVLIRE